MAEENTGGLDAPHTHALRHRDSAMQPGVESASPLTQASGNEEGYVVNPLRCKIRDQNVQKILLLM